MTKAKDITGRLPRVQHVGNGSHGFKEGCTPGPGRPKGSQDRMTREIKQALLDAAEFCGEEIVTKEIAALIEQGVDPDPALPRGITGFFVSVGRTHPQVLCAMLARIMPVQQTADVQVEHRYTTIEEINERLRQLGLEPKRIYPLLRHDEKKTKPIEGEPNGRHTDQ
jgi:hypothetical protein